MLTEQEIRQALRASHGEPMAVAAPHGPFGWEHLAQNLARHVSGGAGGCRVIQSLEVPAETWEKLEKLAEGAARNTARPVSVSELAAAILQHYVSGAR